MGALAPEKKVLLGKAEQEKKELKGCHPFDPVRGFAATQRIREHRSLRVNTAGVNPQ